MFKFNHITDRQEMKFLIVISSIIVIVCIINDNKSIQALPTGSKQQRNIGDHEEHLADHQISANNGHDLWNLVHSNDEQQQQQSALNDDEFQQILNTMDLPLNISTYEFGNWTNETNVDSNLSQQGFVIIWRNPYQLNHGSNDTDELTKTYERHGRQLRDGDDEDDHHPPSPPRKYEFDEMEQRDFLRTVIFLANQQIRIKFHLCEMRRFRSHFIRRWNLYRCSARFTVARLGKACDPDQTYDGYVNFIVQNPELPPLLAIRYYVFQFLYESSIALVNKMNDHPATLISSTSSLSSSNQLHTDVDQYMMMASNDGKIIE